MAKDTKIYTSGPKTYPDNPSFDRPGYNGATSKAKFDSEIQKAYQSKLGRSASEKELEFRRNANVNLKDQLRDIANSPEAMGRGQGGGGEGGGGHGGGKSDLPGIDPIDDLERLVESQITQFLTGANALGKDYINSVVGRGKDDLDDVKKQLERSILEDANARGLLGSGLLTEEYAKMNKNYMEDLTNLRRDVENSVALTNLGLRQFGIQAGLNLNSVRRNSALGAANVGIAQGQLDLGNKQFEESIRQFNESLGFSKTQQALDQQNQKNQIKAQKGSTLGGLLGAGIIGGALAFSDKRMKENIKKVGRKNGFNLYEFNFKGNRIKKFIGVIAQEVKKLRPDAVIEENGVLKVFYSMLGLKMQEV